MNKSPVVQNYTYLLGDRRDCIERMVANFCDFRILFENSTASGHITVSAREVARAGWARCVEWHNQMSRINQKSCINTAVFSKMLYVMPTRRASQNVH